jgi:hypothetical protein
MIGIVNVHCYQIWGTRGSNQIFETRNVIRIWRWGVCVIYTEVISPAFLQLIWICCILGPIVFHTWRRGVLSSHACNAVQQSVNMDVGFRGEDGGSTCLRNAGTNVPKCRASLTSRIASSVTLNGPSQFPNTSMGRPTGGSDPSYFLDTGTSDMF